MNCREAEKYIYLYTELDLREREEIARHVETCAPCSRLLEAVKTQRSMITAAAQVVPRLPDASRMTQSIMEVVHDRQRKKKSLFNITLQMSPVNVLRYSMAMISFLLIVTFVTEYSAGVEIASPYKAMPAKRNTVLNSASFHAAFVENKESGESRSTIFYECILNCLQVPDGDCEGCRKQIAKLN